MNECKLLFGTTNQGKLAEVRKVLAPSGIAIEGLESLGSAAPHVVEGLPSYEGNAALKSRAYAAWSGRPCIADDTGIEIDELRGLPGVYSARFGLRRAAEILGCGRPSPARFVCCIAYSEPNGRTVCVHGELRGVIEVPSMAVVSQIEGTPLPYSPVFTPAGEAKSLSDMHASGSFLSHRGRAVLSLMKVLGWA
jgi:XTP/dITP diphosphohydrolase